MKQLVRKAGKTLLSLVESVVGEGPYRRLRHLEETLRKRDEQVQRWQARSKARRAENERLKRRLEAAVERRMELERILRLTPAAASPGDAVGSANERVSPSAPSAKALLETAWSGWWELGKNHLLSRAFDGDQSPSMRYQAFVALAEVSRAESDPQSELDYLYRAARVRLPKPPSPALLIQVSYLRMLAGSVLSAERILHWVPDDRWLVEKSLLAANAHQVSSESNHGLPPAFEPFRKAVNAIFENFELTAIESVAAASPSSLPAMRTRVEKIRRRSGPKVSVIVPVFNCEATLSITMDSLEQQAWRDLEIIVVDDGSSDGTLRVAREFERTSDRVEVHAHAENRGAYAARNTGLKHARGQYITVCDAGDWAHPEKIQLQVLDLLASGSLVNWSQWVRCDPGLRFHPRTRGLGRFVHDNPSSLMFDRVVFEACGAWDEIRVSGDTEFRMRIQRVLKVVPRRVLEGCPLTIGILEDSSLTQAHDTRGRSLYRGVRHEYLHSAMAARNQAAAEARRRALRKAVQSPLVVRPPVIQSPPQQTIKRTFGIVFVADFSDGCCESYPMLELAEASLRRGLTVGFVHLPASAGEFRAPSLWSRVRAASVGAEWVAPGESVTSRLIVTTGSLPLWGGDPIDEFPKIDCNEIWIILRSRRREHGFVCGPTPLLEESLAAYFGRAVRKIRYLKDLDWSTDASPNRSVPQLEGFEPLKGTLERWLTRRIQWMTSLGARPQTGRDYGESTVRLLGCPNCSADWHPPESSLRALAAEAQWHESFIQVPEHLWIPNDPARDPREIGSLVPEPDIGRIAPDRAPAVYQATRGLYMASPAVGSRYCWEPLVATALGNSLVMQDVAGPPGSAGPEGLSGSGAEAAAIEPPVHSR